MAASDYRGLQVRTKLDRMQMDLPLDLLWRFLEDQTPVREEVNWTGEADHSAHVFDLLFPVFKRCYNTYRYPQITTVFIVRLRKT